jgi:hypothetical protein
MSLCRFDNQKYHVDRFEYQPGVRYKMSVTNPQSMVCRNLELICITASVLSVNTVWRQKEGGWTSMPLPYYWRYVSSQEVTQIFTSYSSRSYSHTSWLHALATSSRLAKVTYASFPVFVSKVHETVL